MSFICHIHNYTEYNEKWNVFSAFNPSKCTHIHTWSSGQPTLRRPGSSWGFGALLKGLTSVVDNTCRSRDSNPQPRVTSGFKSNALSIRPRLPPTILKHYPQICERKKCTNTTFHNNLDPKHLHLFFLHRLCSCVFCVFSCQYGNG